MGKDFTGYGEIRIKRVPEELKARIRQEAKQLGIDERAVMLMKLWGSLSTPDRGSLSPPRGALSAPNSTPEERYQLPEWVPREAWWHFEEMRRKSRKPMTEAAKKLAVRQLEKLKGAGQDAEKVLEQSVYRGWQGLFPVDGGTNGQEGRRLNYAEQRIEDNLRAYHELFGDDEGEGDRAAGDDAGGIIQRTDAQGALVPIRRTAR